MDSHQYWGRQGVEFNQLAQIYFQNIHVIAFQHFWRRTFDVFICKAHAAPAQARVERRRESSTSSRQAWMNSCSVILPSPSLGINIASLFKSQSLPSIYSLVHHGEHVLGLSMGVLAKHLVGLPDHTEDNGQLLSVFF